MEKENGSNVEENRVVVEQQLIGNKVNRSQKTALCKLCKSFQVVVYLGEVEVAAAENKAICARKVAILENRCYFRSLEELEKAKQEGFNSKVESYQEGKVIEVIMGCKGTEEGLKSLTETFCL